MCNELLYLTVGILGIILLTVATVVCNRVVSKGLTCKAFVVGGVIAVLETALGSKTVAVMFNHKGVLVGVHMVVGAILTATEIQ